VRPAALAEAPDRHDHFFMPAGPTAEPSPPPMRPVAPCTDTPALRRASTDSETAGQTALLVEALRKGRRTATPPPELAAAQASLERRVRAHMEHGSVRITLTDNRYTMISVRRLPPRGSRDRHYDVRLHLMFADADPVITRALARYVADNDRDASRVLGDFIDANQGQVKGRARRAPTQIIVTTGEHHDLRAIYDDLNTRYFDGKIDAVLTWGPRNGRPRRRNSIKMGSYSVEDRLIRIHRSLDRAFVPRFFVEWIVFHEMLHQVHDIKVKNGRREFHTPAFYADEARFEHYHEARAWERRHLDALLTY
jgi:hypothetical protein